MTEQFHRHPEVPASEDVALKTFYIAIMEIKLLYHYEDNFVTKSTRTFFKPNLMDTGGVLSYVPELTTGYVVCNRRNHVMFHDVYITGSYSVSPSVGLKYI